MKHPPPRRRRLLVVAGAAAVLAVAGAGLAVTEASADAIMMVSDDGTQIELPAQAARDASALAGAAGTGRTGTDGADHATDPTITGADPTVTGDDGPSARSVIGRDDRTRIKDTTGSVAGRSIVQLTYENDKGRWQFCSGFLFGADTVVTAGHCVFDRSVKKWMTYKGTLRAWPGRNGTSDPYGSCTVKRLHSVTGWTADGNRNYDFGALKLNCSVGKTTGWFGIWHTTANLDDKPITVRGYPCDQSYGTQWYDTDRISKTTSHRLFYKADTWDCESGSPAYNKVTGSCGAAGCVVAIHTCGTSCKGADGSNSGTRITAEVADYLAYWRNN